MKIVIPLAGMGTRMRPHTFSRPKPLLNVAGQPMLKHLIDSLEPLNADEYIFIVGYLGEQIESVEPDSYEYPPMEIRDLSPYESIRIVDGNPCTNCIASLASYLHGYIDRGIIENATERVDILIGRRAKSKKTGREIAIGNCLQRYRGKIPFVSGCPPPSDAYLELVQRGLKGDFRVTTVNKNAEVVEVSETTVKKKKGPSRPAKSK